MPNPPPSAQPEILVRAEIQDVERGQALLTVRFEANRRVAVLAIAGPPSGSAVRKIFVRCPLTPDLALEEAGHDDVVWQPVGRADIAGPGPRFVQREELVVRSRDALEALTRPAAQHPPESQRWFFTAKYETCAIHRSDARLVSVNSIELNRSVLSAFTRLRAVERGAPVRAGVVIQA